MNALYLQSIEGRLVPRFASLRGTLEYVGATRIGRRITWSDKIVKIPPQEAARFAREYKRAIDCKDVRRCTETEYTAQVAAAAERASQPEITADEVPAIEGEDR